MLTRGQTIGAYELVRRLGGGAFGDVWLARHTDLGDQVALKVPTDALHVEQLRSEGRHLHTLRDLDHPNIVRLVHLDTQHDPPYLAMEYVPGRDLRAVLEESARLPLADALNVVAQVLDALRAAHARSLLHRDIKPSNILLADDGTAKVTDFGLGRLQADTAQSLRLSFEESQDPGSSEHARSIAGTLAHMSPEVRDGATAEPSDDLYAVGLVTCELLTCLKPGANMGKELARADVPGEVVEVLDKACDRREFRYRRAEDMAPALRDALRAHQGRADAEKRRAEEEETARRSEAERQTADALRPERERQQAAPAPVEVVSAPPQPRRETRRKLRTHAVNCLVVLLVVLLVVAAVAAVFRFAWTGHAPSYTVYTDWPFDTAEAKRRQQETANALGVKVEQQVDIGGGVTPTMVLIPAGELLMGSAHSAEEVMGRSYSSDKPGTGVLTESLQDEHPQHRVAIAEPFRLSQHEVTQKQWTAVMGSNPSKFRGADLPVEMVNWDDCQEFCRRLTKREQEAGTLPKGVAFRLPTEAEWEYACRAGTATRFHYGPTISAAQVNWASGRTSSVGSFAANAWGLRNMHGNVQEWTASPYAEHYDGSESKGPDAPGPARVVRGGCWWFSEPAYCGSPARIRYEPTERRDRLGFRLCCSLRRVARSLP